MYQQFYLSNPYVDFALVAFVIFMGVFAGALIRFLRMHSSSEELRLAERLPLEEDRYDGQTNRS